MANKDGGLNSSFSWMMGGIGKNGTDEQTAMDVMDTAIVCYSPTMITTNGIWQGDDPLQYSLPLFILQLTLVVVITRILFFVLKPLRQPRVISEIIGGVLLGPSAAGSIKLFARKVFPLRSVMVLETMANVGLLYFLFLVGVEMDLTVIKRTGKRALSIAVAGIILPFIIAFSFTSFMPYDSAKAAVMNTRLDTDVGDSTLGKGTYVIFLGVALSVTAFPVLARILAELKLLHTELGRIAMSAAIINDMFAWVLLGLGIALAEHKAASFTSLWVVLSTTAFVLFCIYAIRPGISWIINRTPEGENFSEFHISLILTGVMICGFVTDAFGSHAIFGAFVFGLIIPNGPLGAALVEKLEDFVSGLLLPLYFGVSGLRTNVWSITSVKYTMVAIVLGCAAKVIATLAVSLFYQMPLQEGIALGLLMNTKGLVEIIVLNIGRDQKILGEKQFTTMVIVAVIMTGIISPVITFLYRPARRFIPYKRRTIQRSKPDAELRILACIHTPRNVPTTINLLEASHPTRKSPIFVYALHLVELTGRASAMLIVHNTRKSGRPAVNRTQAQSDHIINAFENYEQHAVGVTVQPLTAISPYSTMHEDICTLAEDKRVAFIIVPFHKQQTVDGGMEATNPAFRNVNQNILANAPCSVGILVDRGLGGSGRVAVNHISHHIAMLFFGGPDDREALAYASRMAEHPGISVTVVRFIAGDDVAEQASTMTTTMKIGSEARTLEVITDNERSNQIDDEYMNEFRLKNVSNESIVYKEKVVNNGEETVAAIRSIDNVHDLYIVGRGQGIVSPLTAGLTDWSECPELGAIGDLLASSDFAATISVLVVQQYAGLGPNGEGVGTPESQQNGDQFVNIHQMNLRSSAATMGGSSGGDVDFQQRGGGGGAANGFGHVVGVQV